MSLGHNERLRQFLDLLERGEVHRARQGCTNQEEWAARLGMSVGTFRGVQRRARELGHAVPGWSVQSITDDCLGQEGAVNQSDSIDNEFDFSDEEVTKPDAEARVPAIANRATNQATVAPSESDVPLPAIGDGFRVRAKSTLVRPDGSIAGQWIKTAANSNDVDPVAVLRAAFGEEMPRAEPVLDRGPVFSDLLCVYPLGDPHVGMLAWEQETGENFDLSIAERNLHAAADHLVSLAPPANQALVVSVGDYFHSDGQNNATTKGTRVDVDGRTPKMIAVGIRVMRRIIECALTKHERVHVICARGNHDELLSLVLAIALTQFYENEPRVTVDQSPEMHHWYRFGQNLIGVHHGDKTKPMDLLGVMANDRKEDWGQTTHRRFYCGHIHHDVVKEVPGVTVEYIRTLASGDAWHRGQGYRSGRDMKMDVFHREHGHINRHIVGIERVRSVANG